MIVPLSILQGLKMIVRWPGRLCASAGCCLLVAVAMMTSSVRAEERFPPPDFQSGYQMPREEYPLLSPRAWDWIDVSLLAAALAVAVYLAHVRRSRAGLLLLSLGGVGYFGFFRQGCVCPIGSIQNVTSAAFDPALSLPWVVGAFFVLPLAVSLFYGRVFCSGVCPLGALQDIVSWKSLRLPRWLEAALGVIAFAYLLLAVVSASIGGPFLICQYDPFVSFFRLSGPAHMLVIGIALLLLGLVIGRPYCRFLCPYGALLRITSRYSWKRVHVAPGECINCHLCRDACPYNAILSPLPASKAPPSSRRRQFVGSAFVSLLVVGLLTLLGYTAGSRFATVHRDVQLASDVLRGVNSDATRAFADSGVERRALFDYAREIQQRSATGMAIAAGLFGVVIARRLLRSVQLRAKNDYTADPAACLACGRCFAHCPVELRRRGVIVELPQVAESPQEKHV